MTRLHGNGCSHRQNGQRTPKPRADREHLARQEAEARAAQEYLARQTAEARMALEHLARQTAEARAENAEAELTKVLAELERLQLQKND